MAEAMTKLNGKTLINICVMLAIIFGFRLIPPADGLTADGLAVVGIFLGVLYGWLFIDMVWPSLIGLVILGATLPEPMDKVLGSAFGNNTVLLLLFFCMVASIINAAGIAEYVARKIISVPFLKGRPYVLVFMLSLAMIALATMLTMTAAVLVAFPLVKEVCRQYGYKPGDSFPMLLLLAMLFVADIAYMALPFKSLPAIVFGIYSQMSGGQEINLAAYVGVCTIVLLLCIGFVIVLYKYIIKPDVSLIITNSKNLTYDEKLTPYQQIILWSFVGLIVVLLLPNILPRDFVVTKFLRGLGNNGILLAWIGLYLAVGFIKGISIKEVMSKSVTWPAIFLVVAVLKITGAFEQTGVTQWLGAVAQPYMEGFNGQVFVLIIVVTATLATQLTNNNACAATLAPIAYTLAVANGNVDPQAILTCVILSCTLGIATPAAATTSAILYGDTEWVKPGILVKYATYFWVFNIIMLSFVCYNLCRVMF